MNPDPHAGGPAPTALASLRRFMQPRATLERCELCAAGLAAEHDHLVEPASRRLLCACEACAILFSDAGAAKYRRVPRGVQLLADFRLTDLQWEALQLPINLAFFLHSSPLGRVVALYPSPAGATEALPPPEDWRALAEDNPVLHDFEPDVEALLVNHLGPAPEYYRLGIDKCYELVGLIRSRWRGLSGGTEVWEEIGRFFTALKERSDPKGGTAHA
jgi:Family of unknown function (DUF5947)